MIRPSGGAAAAIAALSPGCRRPGTSGRIDIDAVEVRAGAGGIFEDGRWMPVVVRARAAGGKVFRGEVEVSGILGDGSRSPERFRARFDAAGEMQAVEVPVLPRRWASVAVTFRGEGIPEETCAKKLPAAGASPMVWAACGHHRPGVAALRRARRGSLRAANAVAGRSAALRRLGGASWGGWGGAGGGPPGRGWPVSFGSRCLLMAANRASSGYNISFKIPERPTTAEERRRLCSRPAN